MVGSIVFGPHEQVMKYEKVLYRNVITMKYFVSNPGVFIGILNANIEKLIVCTPC